jgi:hypothetical protein
VWRHSCIVSGAQRRRFAPVNFGGLSLGSVPTPPGSLGASINRRWIDDLPRRPPENPIMRSASAATIVGSGTLVRRGAKIRTTFDVYGHLLSGSHDDVRVRMDAYLAAR